MATGLLVIDLQRGMFGPGGPPYEGEAVLSRIAGLLGRARERGAAVLHVRHNGGPGDDLERHAPGWEIHPAVAPLDGQPVIDKDPCSAFHAPDLPDRLQARRLTPAVVPPLPTPYPPPPI